MDFMFFGILFVFETIYVGYKGLSSLIFTLKVLKIAEWEFVEKYFLSIEIYDIGVRH